MKRYTLTCFAAAFWVSHTCAQQFQVSYSKAAFEGPFTGHVTLYLSKTVKESKNELYQPVYGRIVQAVKPGRLVIFDHRAKAFPAALYKLERGLYVHF